MQGKGKEKDSVRVVLFLRDIELRNDSVEKLTNDCLSITTVRTVFNEIINREIQRKSNTRAFFSRKKE